MEASDMCGVGTGARRDTDYGLHVASQSQLGPYHALVNL